MRVVCYVRRRALPVRGMFECALLCVQILLGKPLFPGKNVVHQLELITDLLGTPSAEVVNKVRNEKARRYLQAMKKKPGIPFQQKFPGIRDDTLSLLARLLAFDPSQRPTVGSVYLLELLKPNLY